MLKNKDRYLQIILISPSILAVAIFVYGFIAWSVRVSLSNWKGLTPDYSWAGSVQPRQGLDLRPHGLRSFPVWCILTVSYG